MVKIVTSFATLMKLAKAEANAKKSGDIELYEKAKQRHESYKRLCLKSDHIEMGCTLSALEAKNMEDK